MKNIILCAAAAIASAVTLNSCALLTKSKDNSNYYSLRSNASGQIANRPALHVHVRSVQIPGYLDRRQLVRRTTANELDVQENHLWAESLDKQIARNITESLRQLLGSSQIVALDSELADVTTGLRLDVEITRFEANEQNVVILEGIYAISNRTSGTQAPNRSFSYTTPLPAVTATTAPASATIAAMNASLDQLNRRIASDLAK